MSNVVEHDFGRNPCIDVGDCIVVDLGEGAFDALVIGVERRFTKGAITGQAMLVEVGVPLGEPEEGEWLTKIVRFNDIVSRRHHHIGSFGVEEKAGKVLQFESVLCNDPLGVV